MIRLTFNNRAIPELGVILCALFLVSIVGSTGYSQATPPPNGQGNPQAQDLINQLNLSPDQLDKIKAIGVEQRPERQAANLRVRDAEKALDNAIYVDNADDTIIAAKAKELAEARAEIVRLQAIREVRIRRILTSEQLSTFLTLRQNFRDNIQRRRAERNQGPGTNAGKGTLTPADRAMQRRINRDVNRGQGRNAPNGETSGFANQNTKPKN